MRRLLFGLCAALSALSVPQGVSASQEWSPGGVAVYENDTILAQPSLFDSGSDSVRIYKGCFFPDVPDHSLYGSAIYESCTFELSGTVPLLTAWGCGAVFLGCTFKVRPCSCVVFTHGGKVVLADCEFEGTEAEVCWRYNLKECDRFYQSGVRVNGEEYVVSRDTLVSVDMEGTELEMAYRFEYDGRTVYNLPNILSGADPFSQLGLIHEAEQSLGLKLTGVQTELPVITEVDAVLRQVRLVVPYYDGVLAWEVSDEDIYITPADEKGCFTVRGVDGAQKGKSGAAVVRFFSGSGLQAAVELPYYLFL